MTNAGGGVFHGLFANNWRKTGSMPFTLGKTIGIAINMDTNPRQIWITPDVTGTGGCGGGPLWNGDVNSAPVAHGGCGGPGTGQGTFGPGDTGLTGMGFFLAGAFPAWTGQDFSLPGSSVTFDFTDSATLDATIPTYLPWNTAGGSPSVSGPLNPMVRNIANAPARQQSTAYTAFPQDNRVLAGPGYHPSSGLYTNGQPLWLWAVAPGGGGTSGTNASYAATFASCPSPAGVGGTVAPGGYTGSETATWAAAPHVTDGDMTWVCVTKVDYNTFTGANVDDVVNWATNTPYYLLQFVINSATGNVYYLQEGSAGPPPASLTCTSGSTPPSGTTFGTASSDAIALGFTKEILVILQRGMSGSMS